MRRIFHLYLKAADEHKYYGSLSAIFIDNQNLGVSKFTLDRFNFDNTFFENDACIIRKGLLMSTGEARANTEEVKK